MEHGLGALQEEARAAVFLRMIGGYILVFAPGGPRRLAVSKDDLCAVLDEGDNP